MIYIVESVVTFLFISFFIFTVINVYCKIVKRESKAFLGAIISLIAFFSMMELRNHLIKQELVKDIIASKIQQPNSNFSKRELSDIHISSEKMRVVDEDINIILLPRKDTVYLNQDFYHKNKFWIYYKKYEILGLTAPVGYIIKN